MSARDGWAMTLVILAGIHAQDSSGGILVLMGLCVISAALGRRNV